MSLTDEILASLPDGEVKEVRIGLHWTAVAVDVGGEVQCGLASTLLPKEGHRSAPDVLRAGSLEGHGALGLARMIQSQHPAQASVGAAAINALLPKRRWEWAEKNAEEVLAFSGRGKNVVVIGRFPFLARIEDRVGRLTILERNPGKGDLPEEDAPKVLPGAEVVAITGMTFVNQTLEEVLAMCPHDALTILLGPSTPLSPLLFDYGVDLLCGAVVREIDQVLRAIGQGANFRQVHHAGVALVTLDQQAFHQV